MYCRQVLCDDDDVRAHKTAQEQCLFTSHNMWVRGEDFTSFCFILLETSISFPKKEINIQYLWYLCRRIKQFYIVICVLLTKRL